METSDFDKWKMRFFYQMSYLQACEKKAGLPDLSC